MRPRAFTRNGYDWTARYAPVEVIATAARPIASKADLSAPPLHEVFAMAMVLIQRVLRGYVFPLIFGQWDFSDPLQSNEILTVGF